mgnify:CR=1 FL=1
MGCLLFDLKDIRVACSADEASKLRGLIRYEHVSYFFWMLAANKFGFDSLVHYLLPDILLHNLIIHYINY